MKRRMITDDIVSAGKFLRMSPSAQALWMHCLAHCDDDGIVDVFSVFKMVGAKEDDVVLLVEREFLTPLDQKDYIYWITGFQDFNKIQPHIKEDSQYLPLLLAKVQGVEIVKSTKADDNKRRYAQLKEQRKLLKSNDPIMILQDHGHDPTTRLGKDRLGKDRLGKGDTIASNNLLREIVNYFFELKQWNYEEHKVVYSRYVLPAKNLLHLCEGDGEEAKLCLKKISEWATSRKLDWSIETVFKKWYEIDNLLPLQKKPYIDGYRAFQQAGKWKIIMNNGEIVDSALYRPEVIWK